MAKKRQFGFAFLLFVPYLAYWGYNTWIKAYKIFYSKTKDSIKDLPNQEATGDTGTDIVGSETRDSDVTAFSTVDYQTAITNSVNGTLTNIDCQVINSMLRSSNFNMLSDGLKLVSSISVRSSTETKDLLFDLGLGRELTRLIRSRKHLPLDTVQQVVTCISNLSMSERGQTAFKDVVVDIADTTALSSQLTIPSLHCLTNLSVTEAGHLNFTKLVDFLYRLLDDLPKERVYVLRTLVNLSTNSTMSPHLLAARAPRCSLKLLESSDEDVMVRWLRVLVSISTVALNQNLSISNLPVVYKAPSPETLYSFLFGVESTNLLMATLLHRRENSSEAKNLANFLYKNISLKAIAYSS